MIRLGIFTDIHYGAWDYVPGYDRYYRDGIGKLKNCIEMLNQQKIDMGIFMGDILDFDKDDAQEDVNRMLIELADTLHLANFPLVMLPGNHDTGHFTRKQLCELFKMPVGAMSFTLKDCRMILVDTCCDAAGVPVEAEHHDWRDFYLSPTQIEWLNNELQTYKGKNKLILSHILIGMSHDMPHEPHLIRNNSEVRAIIDQSDVNCVLQGHYHWGDYTKTNDVHYITFKGMTCGPLPEGAFYVCEYDGDTLDMERFCCTEDFMGAENHMRISGMNKKN